MATIKEHIAQLENTIAELAKQQLDLSLLSTLDAIGFLKLRLAEGENADGGRFSDYGALYAKERQQAGFRTDIKDFARTGRLYASIQPEVKSEAANQVQVNIVPKGQENIDKVAGQAFYKGDIVLALSQSEIADITAIHEARVNQKIQELLNG